MVVEKGHHLMHLFVLQVVHGPAETTCNKCFEKFDTPNKLEEHLEEHRKKEKPLECDLCKKR